MKSSLKICPIFFFLFLGLVSFVSAQTITVQPTIETEFNLYNNVSLWVWAPAGELVNAQFQYFTDTGDTTVTEIVSNTSVGVSHQFVFETFVVDCDSLWSGFAHVWLAGQDTIQSNQISWSLVCPGEVSVSLPSVSVIEGVGVKYSFEYHTGDALADLFWYTAVDGEPLLLNSVELFDEGVYTDTLFLSGGQSYQICFPEIINPISVDFIPGCVSGVMPSFIPTPLEAELFASELDGILSTQLLIINSGNINSNFVITVEQMNCDGTYEVFDEFLLEFSELIVDSLVTLPVIENLPFAPAWRVTLDGSNESFELTSQMIEIDIALGLSPVVSDLSLIDNGDGLYSAVVTWDDLGAGNPTLLVYLDDELVVSLEDPVSNTVTIPIPNIISVYSGGVVSVMLVSNACTNATTMVDVPACGPEPTHILESAYNITATSAQVQIAYANFYGCVEDAMVGIVLLDQDTVWTSQTVNTVQSSNYLFALDDLTPGTTYLYQAILFASGQYFTSNFTLSFTTDSDDPIDPFFTNFFVNWDMDMVATVFTHYNLGDEVSVGLRVWYDSPESQAVVVLNTSVSNQFTSFDHVILSYGTHSMWVELYNTETNVVYQTTDVSIHTYQAPPVSVTEIGQTITRFDRVAVYDVSGRVLVEFAYGEMLLPNLSAGVYLFVGIQGKEKATSKIYLGQ